MKPNQLAGGFTGLLLVCVAIFLLSRAREKPTTSDSSHSSTARYSQQRAPQDISQRDKAQDRLIRAEWASLQSWLAGNPPPAAEQIRARLRALRSDWAQLDPHVLASTLASLLQSNENAQTGLPFAVGPQGFLSGWPDLRTFLVDALAIADPEEASKIARNILRDTNSSAEFAVAIRSLIRGNESQATAPELLSCFNTLLSRKEWQGDAATAESLDLARYLGNTEAAKALLDWNGNSKARDMALHEFAADHPAAMISTLSEKSDPTSPETPALLARADPADPAQAAAIDSYLRNPNIPVAQREAFLSLYPLRSLTTGYRLYRNNPIPYDESGIRRSDEAALSQAEAWLADPTMEPLHDKLSAWKSQLLDWQKSDP